MPSRREGGFETLPIPEQSPRTSPGPSSALFRQVQHLPKLGDQAAQVGALPEDLAALAAAVEAVRLFLGQHPGWDGLNSQADAGGQQGGFVPWARGGRARISQTGLCKTKSSA